MKRPPTRTAWGAPSDPLAFVAWATEQFGIAVVLTLGSRGAVTILEGQAVRAEPPRVDVIDTTGAGDALAGALVAALDRGDSLPSALGRGRRRGCSCLHASRRAGVVDLTVQVSAAKQVKSISRKQLSAKAMRSITRHVVQFVPRLRTLVVAFLLSLAIVRPAAAVDFTDLWVTSVEDAWGVNFVQSNADATLHLRDILHLRTGPATDVVHRGDVGRTRMAYGRAR